MKTTHRIMLAALVAFAQTLAPTLTGRGGSALQAQEAFYIYRNDGDFNGFFYDQVVRMGYSKVDLNAEEHDVYVIQEIETRDSLYRIPLAAIDSIGFQQPEAKFSPRLQRMDLTGHSEWFDRLEEQTDGTARIYFRAGLPASLRPKVGDVLAGFDEAVYGVDGFVGKVVAVRDEGGQTACQTVPIEGWDDLFEQFIGVEQLGCDQEGNVRRRVAGLDKALRRLPRRAGDDDDGNYDLTLINWSGRLQFDDSDAHSSVSCGIDVSFEVKMNITYSFDTSGCFLKLTANENLSASPSIHAQYSGTVEKNFPTPLSLPAIKFPLSFPIFETDPFPEGFVRLGGSFDVGLKLPGIQFPLSQSIIINTHSDDIISRHWGNGSEESAAKTFQDDIIDWKPDLSVVANGFVQAGSKVKFEVATNRWVKNIFFMSVGMDIYSGPKADLELNLSSKGLYENGAYGMLKDSRVGLSLLSVDCEAKAKVFARGIAEKELSLWNQTWRFFASDWYLFPDFDDTEAAYDQKSASVKATVSPSRQVFKASDIGIGLYDSEDNRLYEQFNPTPYSFRNNFNQYSATFAAEALPAGKYTAVPLVRSFGTVLPAKGKAKEVIVPPYIKFSTKKLAFASASTDEQQHVVLQTNGEELTIRMAVRESAQQAESEGMVMMDVSYWQHTGWLWVLPTIEKTANGVYNLSVATLKPNDKSVYDRYALIEVTCTSNGYTACDTLVVTQYGLEELPLGAMASVMVSIPTTLSGQQTSVVTRGDEVTSEEHKTVNSSSYYAEQWVAWNREEEGDEESNLNYIESKREGDILVVKGHIVTTDDQSHRQCQFTLNIDVANYPGQVKVTFDDTYTIVQSSTSHSSTTYRKVTGAAEAYGDSNRSTPYYYRSGTDILSTFTGNQQREIIDRKEVDGQQEVTRLTEDYSISATPNELSSISVQLGWPE